MEVKRNLEQATGLELPPTLVFDYPSMTELAAFLLQQLPPTASMPVPVVSEAALTQQSVQAGLPKDRKSMQAAAGEAAQPSTASASAGPAWGPMTHLQRVAYFKQQVGLNKLCRTPLGTAPRSTCASWALTFLMEKPDLDVRQRPKCFVSQHMTSCPSSSWRPCSLVMPGSANRDLWKAVHSDQQGASPCHSHDRVVTQQCHIWAQLLHPTFSLCFEEGILASRIY